MAAVRKFFEVPYKNVQKDKDGKEVEHDNWTYVCIFCKDHGIKNRGNLCKKMLLDQMTKYQQKTQKKKNFQT